MASQMLDHPCPLSVHLHESTRKAVAEILPGTSEDDLHILCTKTDVRDITYLAEWTGGQLAKIAAWPDRVRGQYPWSGQLHYVTPLAPEHPPDSCAWSGSFKTQANVLNGQWSHSCPLIRNVASPYSSSSAIQNYTARVALDRSDIDLRFLVHFVSRCAKLAA